MNPKEIGSLEVPPPKTEDIPPQENENESIKKAVEGESEDGEFVARSAPEVDETSLVNQEFLLDPDLTVRDFLLQNSVEVVDFVRFECGEEMTDES